MILQLEALKIIIYFFVGVAAAAIFYRYIQDRRITFVFGLIIFFLSTGFLRRGGSTPEEFIVFYYLVSSGLGAGLLLSVLFPKAKIPLPPQPEVVALDQTPGKAAFPLIKIIKISKEYPTGEETTLALDNVNLEIRMGEFVAIMGPSGSGKSTLMHILGLLDNPSRGEYFLEGVPLANLSSSQQALIRNHKVGFVFQQFNLLPRATVLDNVLLSTIYSHDRGGKQRALELIRKVGLESRIGHKSNQLSGGQIQRVAIARALIMQPAIILADEPTGNLDSATSREIMDLLSGINREGRTVILVTHEEDIARYASRIIHLKDGQVVSDLPNSLTYNQ